MQIEVSENQSENDIHMVLATVGLANPVCEALLNKYLIDGRITMFL